MTSPSQSAPHVSTEGENTDQTATSLFGFQLEPAIERIAHWLPTQSPIKDFIHHNTLHALENRPFHEAIAIASRIYGARSYLPLADYQNRYKSGRIKDFAVEHVLESVEPIPEKRRVLRESMFTPNLEAHYPPPSLSHHGIRHAWLTQIEVNLDAQVQPILFRLIANFLDQGISRWSVAREGESLWKCLWRLVYDSFIPLYPFGEPEAKALLSMTPDKAIETCLARIVAMRFFTGFTCLKCHSAIRVGPAWSV